jgi:hypothetical protein
MLKHGAATQSEDAYAETRSSYMVRGRRCRNTELSLSSEIQMLRHSGDRYVAETRTPTVSSQGRHSQGVQFTWLKQPVNCDAEQHQQL